MKVAWSFAFIGIVLALIAVTVWSTWLCGFKICGKYRFTGPRRGCWGCYRNEKNDQTTERGCSTRRCCCWTRSVKKEYTDDKSYIEDR